MLRLNFESLERDIVDLKTYLQERRTIPSLHLSVPGPDENELLEILNLASRSPDHGKLAPWRFIVVKPGAGKQLGRICLKRAEELASQEGRQLTEAEEQKISNSFASAPVIVVLVSTAAEHVKIPEWEQVLAVGAVGMNLIHASNAFGFSAQWLTGWMSYDSEITNELDLSGFEKIAGFFHIGTPTLGPVERARPDVSKLVSHWPA